MANNFSFSTAGSTPNVSPNLSGAFLNMNPSTPQSKALGVAAGSFKPSPTIPAAAPAPVNQPIKKQTVTTAGGDTHTTEYHPPTQAGVLASAPATFSGTVNKLADTSSQGSPVAGTAAKQLVNTPAGTPAAQGYTAQTAQYGAGNIPIGQQAKDIMDKAGAAYSKIGQQGANAEAGYSTTGTSPVAEGNAGVIARNTAEQEAAIQAGAQTALQGTGQELTGQNQAANAANEAAGTALTGQSNQIGAQTAAGNLGNTAQATQQSGLNSAGVLAQPQLGSIGQVPFSPLDQGQGSILGTTQTGGVDAAGNLLGKFQGAQAAGAAPGQTQASNIQTLGTAGAQGQASNIKTAATAGVEANQAVFNKAYDTYTQLQNTVQNVDQFGSLLTSGMVAADGTTINPSDVKYANQKLADVRAQLSSAQQATYDTTLAALRSKVSGLLSVGGNEIPTDISSDARKILDGTLPLGSLNAVLSRIQNEGNILLKNQADVVNTAYSGIQGGGSSSSNSQPNQGGGSQWSF